MATDFLFAVCARMNAHRSERESLQTFLQQSGGVFGVLQRVGLSTADSSSADPSQLRAGQGLFSRRHSVSSSFALHKPMISLSLRVLKNSS